MAKDIPDVPCPKCGEEILQLRLQRRFVPKPLGTYSLAGVQVKMSGTWVDWPCIKCPTDGVISWAKEN